MDFESIAFADLATAAAELITPNVLGSASV
jgi:hypothetical protein